MSSVDGALGAVASKLILPSLRPSFARLCRRSTPVRLLFWEPGDHRLVEAATILNETGSVSVLFLRDEQSPSYAIEALGVAHAAMLPIGTVIRAWRENTSSQRSAAPQSPSELAAAAVALGLVDAVVGGVATSSADVLRAGLKFVGLFPGIRTVSICGFVEPVAGPLAGRLLLMTDTGAVVDPTVDQFVDIARNAIQSWKLVSEERPRMAFVSASTKGSLAGLPNLDRILRAVDIIRGSGTNFDVDGELQLDAAIIPRVASAKGVTSAVAGHANILIFPGIDSCNIGYKIAEHIGGALTVAVTQGLARSYHDVSRGAELADLLGTCVIAAIMGSAATISPRTA
jgi:phosphotransacetylase